MRRALVTGATGLVGSHIVERLLRDGWQVRALARNVETSRSVLPDDVKVHRGDVLDERSFAAAAQGCEVVFHTAANILVRGGWEAYRATNIDGTRNAIAAAERASARLLQLSSVAVYGPSARYAAAERGERTTEDAPLASLRPTAYYARSKRESEEMVMAAHAAGRIWATAVRPCVIYGPRDRQFVPRMAVLIRRGFIPLLRDGRSTMAVVHAANVADGAVMAATSEVAGGRAFNLSNDFDVTVREFFDYAGIGLDRKPRYVPLPMWLARGILRTTRAIAKVLTGGKFSLVSGAALDFISRDNPFSSDRARRELGWSPRVQPGIGIPGAFQSWQEAHNKKGAT
ncbi:MAG TPA: NAD-dependent epimerase/dehydratase family protein [Gemmatimonadaceae bacterium]|nr:NAD-dependent epimerase/dehydratase family protein [Gemmatimonadaceae bacterium]